MAQNPQYRIELMSDKGECLRWWELDDIAFDRLRLRLSQQETFDVPLTSQDSQVPDKDQRTLTIDPAKYRYRLIA